MSATCTSTVVQYSLTFNKQAKKDYSFYILFMLDRHSVHSTDHEEVAHYVECLLLFNWTYNGVEKKMDSCGWSACTFLSGVLLASINRPISEAGHLVILHQHHTISTHLQLALYTSLWIPCVKKPLHIHVCMLGYSANQTVREKLQLQAALHSTGTCTGIWKGLHFNGSELCWQTYKSKIYMKTSELCLINVTIL